MISSFTIGNFKAFGPPQTIPLKPITLVYGPNSAGKSSVIHSLLLARHALDNKGDLDVFKTDVGGDSVDLGGFRQYLFRRKRNPTGEVKWSAALDASNLPKRIRDLIAAKKIEVTVQWRLPRDNFDEPVEGASPEIVSPPLSACFVISRCHSGNFQKIKELQLANCDTSCYTTRRGQRRNVSPPT